MATSFSSCTAPTIAETAPCLSCLHVYLQQQKKHRPTAVCSACPTTYASLILRTWTGMPVSSMAIERFLVPPRNILRLPNASFRRAYRLDGGHLVGVWQQTTGPAEQKGSRGLCVMITQDAGEKDTADHEKLKIYLCMRVKRRSGLDPLTDSPQQAPRTARIGPSTLKPGNLPPN